MATPLSAPKGTVDLLGEEMARFRFLEETARRVFALYGYEEIRTPIFESTDLFVRGIGEVTDIVAKEMYTFTDRQDRSMTLRPEGTAGVVRAALQRSLLKHSAEVKLCYMGPMFRYERPQRGRQRQFHQIGCEWFGNADPWADAEVIALQTRYLEELGFGGVRTRLNTLGTREDRRGYVEKLRAHLRENMDALTPEARERVETNPMRVLDSKEPPNLPVIEAAPVIGDHISAPSRAHFEAVLRHLETLGIEFEIVPRLVRGLDYYTHTVFETTLPGLGAQDAVLGGGRYDHLFEDLGGSPTPGVGASIGVERLAIAMQALEAGPDLTPRVDLAICLLDEGGVETAARLAADCRARGLSVRFDYRARSPKAGLRDAGKAGARFAALIGASELEKGTVQLKNLKEGDQREVPLAEVPAALGG